MLKSAASKVIWVGRATVFMVGLAVILALAFAAASTVLGGRSLPGYYNQIDPITQLVGSDAGGNLNMEPMAMRRQIEYPRGYAQVNVSLTAVTLTGSKGVNDVKRSTTDNSVYCFDLKFVPRAAVASGHINNNATVGIGLGSAIPAGCPAGYRDATGRTFAANTSEARSDLNFNIIFI
jgi:hypothetical protein